jgi:predicted transcriptional regulator
MQLFSEIEFEPLGQVSLIQALEASDVALLKRLRLYSRGVKIRDIANQTNSSQVAVRKSIDNFCLQNGFATRSQLLLALHRTGQLKDG